MTDDKVQKIQDMLRLAENEAATAEEREHALEMAQRFMVKWGVDRAMVDAKRAAEGVTENVETDATLIFSGIFHLAFADVAYRVAEGLGNVKPLMDRRGKQTGIWLIGYPSDVEAAKLFISSIQLQATLALGTWYGQQSIPPWASAMDKFKMRRSFLMAFGVRVGKRLAELNKEEVDNTPGAALVLFDRRKNVEQYHASIPQKNLKSRLSHDHGGSDAGDAAGRRADIGQKAMSDAGRKAIR